MQFCLLDSPQKCYNCINRTSIFFQHPKEVFVCCLIVSLRCVFWVAPSIRGWGINLPRPASQRAAAFILTAAMLTTLAAPAFAGTWYIEDGNITISAGTEAGTNKVEQAGKDTVDNDKDTIITNQNKDTASSNTVTIDAGSDKVEVTLKDVNIDTSSRNKAAVSVTGEGDTNIELDGDNELQGGNRHAGLEHNQTVDSKGNVTSGKLTIQDDNDNAGSLTATGGYFGAGIGGGSAKAGQVTITGGTITAISGDGAGIGGGQGNMGSNAGNADIEISGGTIEATGGYTSAGIGGGCYGDAIIKITGDAVIKNATGGDFGAGIGGGGGGKGDITISGNAKIENAQGGYTGSGIGGGYGAENDKDGNGNQITIKSNESGAPTVNATGGAALTDENGNKAGPGGAGIGSGLSDATAKITIEGKVTIVAKAGEDNAAIGDMNGEQEFNGLDGSITRYDSVGNDITLPTDPGYPVPADTSSSGGGGSADASVQESVFPGLVVTDKDGQRISYTSTQSGNTLTVCVGRLTASFRISLAALRQLRAEGIETITFQTILCRIVLGGDFSDIVTRWHPMGR